MWVLAGAAAQAAGGADELQSIRELAETGNYREATQQLDGYLEENPGNAEGRFLKGIIFSDQKQFDKAIEVFVALTEDYPQLPEPYNNLAVLYASRGDYPKARDALQIAIKTHPSYATAHENLGDIYAMMATEAYNRALELDEENQSVRIKLGMIRELFPEQGPDADDSAPGKERTGTGQPKRRVAAARGNKAQGNESKPSPFAPASSPRSPPSPPRAVPPEMQREVLAALGAWSEAWSNQDVKGYLATYASTFAPPDGMARSSWKAKRRARIRAPKFIEVTVSEPRFVMLGKDSVRVHFIQEYRSNTYQDIVHKSVDMLNAGGNWQIVREEVRK